MTIKALSVFLAVCGFMALPAFAAAVSGSCWPIENSAHQFQIQKTLTAENSSNTARETWDNLGNFEGTCFCNNPSVAESIYFVFKSSRLSQGGGTRSGDVIYYTLDSKRGIDIGINVKIGGHVGEYVPVDLENTTGVDNKNITTRDCEDNSKSYPFGTGSEGIVHLKFNQTLSGTFNIIAQNLITIYARKRTGDFDYSKPFVTLSFNLTVNIPPNCRINDGADIKVPFGNISAGEFNPEATSKQQNVPLKVTCDNPEDVRNVSIKFRAVDFNKEGNIKTQNNQGQQRQDMGIKISHNGKKIDAASAAIPLQGEELTITATPVKQEGKFPEPGDFKATSTLDFEFN